MTVIEIADDLKYDEISKSLLEKFDESNFKGLIENLDNFRHNSQDKVKDRIDSIFQSLLVNLNENQNNPDILILKGLYYEGGGLKEMAKETYFEAAKIDSKNVKYLIDLAHSLFGASYYYNEEKCEFYKQILEICDESSEYYSKLVNLTEQECTEPSDDEYDDDWY